MRFSCKSSLLAVLAVLFVVSLAPLAAFGAPMDVKFAGKTYTGAMLLVNGEPLIGRDGMTDSIIIGFPGMPVIMISGEKYQDLSSVTLTLTGLAPSFTYYIYTDNAYNVQQIETTVNGTYTWTQDLTQKHRIWFQTKKSTYHIDANSGGGDCSSIGSWNSGTNTCTLNQDLTDTVWIDSSSTNLDCDGHSITGSGIIWGGDIWSGAFEGYGIIFDYLDSVSVKNCVVEQWSNGIYVEGVTNALLEGNVVSGSYFGMDLMGGSSGDIIDNEVMNSIHGMRVQSASSLDMSGNNLHDNTYNLFLHNRDDAALQNWNIDDTNTVDGKIVYFLKNLDGVQINPTTYPNAGMIACIDCNNVVIKDYDFSNSGKGIWLHDTTNSQVLNVGGQDIRLAMDIFGGGNNIIDCNNKIWEGATTGYYNWGEWGIMINSWNYEGGPTSNNNVIRNCQVSSSYNRALQVGDYASNNIYENNQVKYFSSHQPAEFYYPSWFHLVMVSGYDAKYNIFRNNVIDTTGMPGGYSSSGGGDWGRMITCGTLVWGGYGWNWNYDPAARTGDNTFEDNTIIGLANGICFESWINKNYFAGNIVTNTDNPIMAWMNDNQCWDQDFSLTNPNFVDGKMIFWQANLQNKEITPAQYPGGLYSVTCYQCNNIKIKDFKGSSAITGPMRFINSNNNVFSNNDIKMYIDYADVMAWYDSSNNIIDGNNFISEANGPYPINFYWQSAPTSPQDNVISNNKFYATEGHTITMPIWGYGNMLIAGNDIKDSNSGIYDVWADSSLATENKIETIYSTFSTIQGQNNKIWHNNLINIPAVLIDSTSALDLGTNIGGNYWSANTGCIDRGDGICSTPYEFTIENTNWQWISPWSNCEPTPEYCDYFYPYPEWGGCSCGTVTLVSDSDNYPFVNQSGWRKFRDDFNVALHIVDQAKKIKSNACPRNAGSCTLPVLGAIVKVFDRNNAEFVSAYTKNPAAINYSNIFEADVGLASMCVTGSDGKCSAWEKKIGDYLAIVRYYASDIDKYLYTGLPKSPRDFDKKGVATKNFQIQKTINADGSVTYKPLPVGGRQSMKVQGEHATIKCTRATKDCGKSKMMELQTQSQPLQATGQATGYVPLGADAAQPTGYVPFGTGAAMLAGFMVLSGAYFYIMRPKK